MPPFAQGLQTLAGIVGHAGLAVVQESALRLNGAAPHSAAQLIELRQTKMIGIIDDGIGVGMSTPLSMMLVLEQHIIGLVDEVGHDAGKLAFLHLPMRHSQLGLRHEAPSVC